MLMVWVFDLSWSFDLFTLTFTWEKLWVLGIVVSAESLRTLANGAARARVVRNGIALVIRGARIDLGHPRIVQECKGKWAHDPCAIRI